MRIRWIRENRSNLWKISLRNESGFVNHETKRIFLESGFVTTIRNESMDWRNESTFLRISYTNPASLYIFSTTLTKVYLRYFYFDPNFSRNYLQRQNLKCCLCYIYVLYKEKNLITCSSVWCTISGMYIGFDGCQRNKWE